MVKTKGKMKPVAKGLVTCGLILHWKQYNNVSSCKSCQHMLFKNGMSRV